MARESFHFGSGSKKFSRQNENFLAPLFQRFRTGIGTFPVRIAKGWDDRPAYRDAGRLSHAPSRFTSGRLVLGACVGGFGKAGLRLLRPALRRGR